MGRIDNLKLKLFLFAGLYLKYKNTRRYRYHVHPVNIRRNENGEYYRIVKLIEKYPDKYFNYFRMSEDHFNFIYKKIVRYISPSKNTFRQDTITGKEKLVIALRYLATGCSFADLSLRFLMGRQTIRRCIYQVVDAINKYLKAVALPTLNTDDWMNIAKEFHERWHFPNCLGAVDGKHVDIFAPNNSGSLNFNYKKRFSTVLMAVVDATYKFVYVDIGAYGSNADSTIFKKSNFGQAFLKNPQILNIPADRCLPRSSVKTPFVLIGDEAFALKENLLTPYSGRNLTQTRKIFNYRLSRARRIVENGFGILSHTWRILLKRIEVRSHATANHIVLTCVILHNLLRTNVQIIQNRSMIVPEEAPVFSQENLVQNINPASIGFDIREKFAHWCVNEGNIDFQYNMI